MAAVDVQTMPLEIIVVDYEGRANAFLTPVVTKVVDSKGEPRKPTFILNSTDFIHLQLYLKAGFQLPADEPQFQVFYPQESFEKFITTDKALYPVCMAQLQ